MNIYGWVFMIFSWVAIIVFTLYTFMKVLKNSNNNSGNNNNNNKPSELEK